MGENHQRFDDALKIQINVCSLINKPTLSLLTALGFAEAKGKEMETLMKILAATQPKEPIARERFLSKFTCHLPKPGGEGRIFNATMLFVEEFSFAIEAAGLPRHQREEFLINSLPISVRNVIQTTFNALENSTCERNYKLCIGFRSCCR